MTTLTAELSNVEEIEPKFRFYNIDLTNQINIAVLGASASTNLNTGLEDNKLVEAIAEELNYSTNCFFNNKEMTTKEIIKNLQVTITAHDILYDKHKPLITDSQYDEMYAALLALESAFPQYISELSPTLRIVPSMNSELKKVKHIIPMLSLKKTTDATGIKDFIKQAPNEPVIVQRKEDGLSIVGSYDNHRAYDFVTRGTGELGESVYAAASKVSNLPTTISFPNKLTLRFEIVVPFEDFESVNVDGKYSNPRNLASGTIRTLK